MGRRAVSAVLMTIASLSFLPCACHGQLVIDVGTFTLQPNASNQVVELFVSNTSSDPISVDALALNLQVADGGPEVGYILDNGAHIRGPHITAVNLLSGTAFQSINSPYGQTDTGSAPQLALYSTTAPHGTVSLAPGKHRLALITLDTTIPMDPGPWDFSLGNTLAGPTSYFVQDAPNMVPTILDGSLVLAPEPAITYTLLAGSRLEDDWSAGGPPSLEAPMTGTFQLSKLPGTPIFALYQITNISFAVGADSSNPIYQLTGNGTWEFGGEVAQIQDASLDVSFGSRSVLLTNLDRTITQPWPMIDIVVAQTTVQAADTPSPALTNTITLRIVATPLLLFSSIVPHLDTGAVELTWLPTGLAVRLERASSLLGPYAPLATNLTAQTFLDTTVPHTQAQSYYRLRLQ